MKGFNRKTQEEIVNTGSSQKEVEEDSVKQDIQKAAGTAKKFIGKFTHILKPAVEKSAEYANTAIQTSSEGLSSRLPRIIKPTAAILVIIFVVFVGYNLVSRYILPVDNKEEVGVVTPTIPPFRTYKPSVYADDSEILAIEDELNILENELDNTTVRQSDLNIPNLDFDINFEED